MKDFKLTKLRFLVVAMSIHFLLFFQFSNALASANTTTNAILDELSCDYTVDLGPDITICEGDPWPVISIPGAVPSNMNFIRWLYNGNHFPQIVSPTSITTFGAGTYTVEIHYGNGCIATDNIQIIVDETCCNYDVDLGPDITICEGDPWPVISIPGAVPSNMNFIRWLYNGNHFPQVVNPTSITTFGAGTYTVEIHYGDGCIATDDIVITVVDCPKPCDVEPRFSFKTGKCAVNFTNLTTGGGGTIIGYLWDFGDGTTSTDENPSHSYLSPGGYTVSLTAYYIDENGVCCTKRWGVSILVEDVCRPTCEVRSFFDVQQVGKFNFLFTANATSNGFTNIINYSWTVDGSPFSPVNPEVWVSTLGPGAHEVCLTVYGLTADGQCCSDTYCTEVVVKEYAEESVLEKVGMYPNPSSDFVTVDFSRIEGYHELAEIVIVNSIGREVYRTVTSDQSFKFNTATWKKGVYHCKIRIGEEVVYRNLSVR